MLWHYHDDDVPGPAAAVNLQFSELPQAKRVVTLTQYRIDSDHSNSFEAWKRLGAPPTPSPEQYAQLEQAGRLAELGTPAPLPVQNSEATIRFLLPRQAVSLIVLTWE
jgi:xylan 1,4-beta-xylosidase